MKKIFTNTLSVKEGRELINEGYKFFVKCDFTTCGTTDPWSGMPNIDNNVAVFKDKAEAEACAAEQVWPFNPNVHGTVEELVWGETWDEMEARLAREKAERKAKREAKEAANAAAMGLTVEEYRKVKARAKEIKTLDKEIAELKKELATKKAELARLMAEAAKDAH